MNEAALVMGPRPRRHRLGAEELLELGRARTHEVFGRQPFLASRLRRPMLQQTPQRAPESVFILDILGSVAGFIAEGLAFAFNTLGDLINIPLGILSQGVDVAFNGLAGLFSGIPVIGDFLAQILVLGGSLIKFGLSIPGLLLHGLGNVLGGVAKFFNQENTDAEQDTKLKGAKDEIISKAPDALKGNVKKILDATGITGGNTTPNVGPGGTPAPSIPGTGGIPGAPGTPEVSGTDLETALAVGVPAVGAIALIAALA